MAICVQCGQRAKAYHFFSQGAYVVCRGCAKAGFSLVKAGAGIGTMIVVGRGGQPVGKAAHLMNKHRKARNARRAKQGSLFGESA